MRLCSGQEVREEEGLGWREEEQQSIGREDKEDLGADEWLGNNKGERDDTLLRKKLGKI